MKVVFLGNGEAFDERYPNHSHLVISEKTVIMLDCGDSAVRQLWKYTKEHSLIDALYITHRHSDHLFGLPAMLGRFHEEKREKPFTIITTKEIYEDIKRITNHAYQGLDTNFSFELKFLSIEDSAQIKFQDLNLSFAPTRHSAPVFAIKINDGKSNICYSGDGMFSSKKGFYEGLDLLIQETYLYDKEIIGHAYVTGAIKFAEDNNVKCLAMVHLNKHFRKKELADVRDKIKSDKVKIIIPEPMDEYNL